MASSLYKKSGSKANKYINLFVNKFLKELDFDWIKDLSWYMIVAKFQAVGPVLQSLRFTHCDGMPLQDLMRYLRNLRVMTHRSKCNDEILKSLTKFCPNVLEIDITGSKGVTNEGIKSLCTKEDGKSTGLKLRKISLDNCRHVDDEAIAYLIKHMPTLEIIDYPKLPYVLYSLHKNDLSKIDKMEPYNFQKFDLDYDSNIPDAMLKICSSLCPRVKTLSCTIRAQEDLKYLQKFRELEQLTLENDSDLDVNIDQLLELRGQKMRYLRVTSVSVSVFALANYCPSLQRLNLEEVNFKNDNMSSIEFPCLKYCMFNTLSKGSAEAIGRLCRSSPSLETVSFFGCSLIEQSVALMCCEKNPSKRTNLTDFEVDSQSLIVSFIQDILELCHSLKKITLDEDLGSSAEAELKKITRSLQNRPEIVVEPKSSSTTMIVLSLTIG